MIMFGNPVPSHDSDVVEGQTTKTYPLTQRMKSILQWRNSIVGSALPLSRDKVKI